MNYKENLKLKNEKERDFKIKEVELSELDKKIKESMVSYLKKIPTINEKQAKEEDRSEKIQASINETKHKICDVKDEISKLKVTKDELAAKCADMRKYRDFLETLRKGEEDIGDIQQLLEKWKRLRECREDLKEKNSSLEQQLETKKNKYKDIYKHFLSESLKYNNMINEVDKQLNQNLETSQNIHASSSRENINDKINELYDLFTKLEYVYGRCEELQKEMKNIVVTNTKKEDSSKEKVLTTFEMKRAWENFRAELDLYKEEEFGRARNLFFSWDRVRDFNETLTVTRNKSDKDKTLLPLLHKQESSMFAKLDKAEKDTQREVDSMAINPDELENISGSTVCDRLHNVFVKVRAVFEKVRSNIKQKFTVKSLAKKEHDFDKNNEEELNQSQNNEVEKEEKVEKKDKNKKDTSDEMLSKKWDDLKMKLDKIKLQFVNLNEAYKKVMEIEKLNKKVEGV